MQSGQAKLSSRALWTILAGLTLAGLVLMLVAAEVGIRVLQTRKSGSAATVEQHYMVDERIDLRVPTANLFVPEAQQIPQQHLRTWHSVARPIHGCIRPSGGAAVRRGLMSEEKCGSASEATGAGVGNAHASSTNGAAAPNQCVAIHPPTASPTIRLPSADQCVSLL